MAPPAIHETGHFYFAQTGHSQGIDVDFLGMTMDTHREIHPRYNLLRDFRYAFHTLHRDRRFACVAIFALALGIGASTVAFSTFYNLLFNAFAALNASRLVVFSVQNEEAGASCLS